MVMKATMRKFSSYGPIDTDLHYYAPRQALLQVAYQQLLGENPEKDGHYITVWGPRQTGKTWVMQQILFGLQHDPRYAGFAVAKINLQLFDQQQDGLAIMRYMAQEITHKFALPPLTVAQPEDFQALFHRNLLPKPLVLILDEFDALGEEAIRALAASFRNIYINRRDQVDIPSAQKEYLLHGVALVGVRAVLGIENATGSPFNVQRSLQIPNLTDAEVEGMLQWYIRERGQAIEAPVMKAVFDETQGQPGLVGWLGELLTEVYNETPDQPLTMTHFARVYLWATRGLPNNTILNIVSKAKQPPYRDVVLSLFKTDKPVPFNFDDSLLNFLYLNGVVTIAETSETLLTKFASPFVQKRLFYYFARELFPNVGTLYDPFADLSDTITNEMLHLPNLLRRYEAYLQANRHWLFKNAPRRSTDERIFEAVYHFNLYRYLADFLEGYEAHLYPEFPTGNGKVDLLIRHYNRLYALEVKSFVNRREYQKALGQAAAYAQRLQLTEIVLILFVEYASEEHRRDFETPYVDSTTGVIVQPVLVATGV